MTIRFNVTSAERKRLVIATGEALGAVPVYMKAPSFAYTVGGFVIDKEGTLSCDGAADGAVLRDMVDRLAEQGFVSDDSPVAMEDSDAEASAENARSANTPADKAPAGEVLGAGDPDRLVIEMPLGARDSDDGFTSGALYNLERLVRSKAALIRKAIDTDSLPIVRENDRISFPWFSPDASPEETAAYTQFVTALCTMAKKQKRVTAKERPADSEKFAFRCFLLRLGFIGTEYAAARNILLRNLSGNGSFKSGDHY